jgi:ABC-type polysaccharide/polyol phosphate transport system ATPase subunit
MPVRTYSTGMMMRLAFSISTSVEADILLMDEWLSVGDAEFTEKAEKRMRDVVSKSGILVLASHSPELIAKECNRVIHLEHGRIVERCRIGSVGCHRLNFDSATRAVTAFQCRARHDRHATPTLPSISRRAAPTVPYAPPNETA